MGMDRRVSLGPTSFSWQQFSELLAAKGWPVQLRMIDGELSFPDETPPEAWRELRIACRAGMLTLRREANVITVVTWGNADAGLQEAWQMVAWGVATATAGQIEE